MDDERARRIAQFIKPLRVKPGTDVTLSKDFDPRYKGDLLKKKDGVELLKTGSRCSPTIRRGWRLKTPTAC